MLYLSMTSVVLLRNISHFHLYSVNFELHQWFRGKESTYSAGDVRNIGLIHGSRRSPRGGNSDTLQYSGLEDPVDRGACQATVHVVAKSLTLLSPCKFQSSE